MFDALFKFDPINFAEGELAFQAGPGLVWFGLLVLVLLAGFGVVYAVTNRFTSDRGRAVSFGLRATVLLLLCLPLFEPVLVMPDVVPDENFVAVLVDASESMNVPDGRDGATRLDEVRRLLFDERDGIAAALDEHFQVRYYAFSADAARADSVRTARADGQGTNLSAALGRVLDDFRGLPLAGVVLLSDGADNSTEVPLTKAEELRSRGVPLHVVGMGREAFEQERELLDVSAAKGVEETTGAEIDVKVRSWAEEPEPVTFELYRGDEVVFTEARPLKGAGRIDQFTFFYEPEETGAQEYTLRVAEAPGELNTENNALHFLIDTRRDSIRVLYFEGHLRRDFKFIKRALEDDQVISFTSVSRTGTGKFYRQGIRHPDELAGGFPASEEELYGFKAVLLGDIEAAAFAPEQLDLLERFVRLRGGGLAMLGGRMSFAEGFYENTPVASALPVDIDPSRRTVIPPVFADPEQPDGEQGFRFVPTAAGYESPILKLSADPVLNQSLWAGLPGLTSLNYLGAVKPGAVVLAEKPEDASGGAEPVLVVQRYGKGRSAALATASTWRWQMGLDAEDRRHERFWRQFVRWLVASAPDRVQIDLDRHRYAPGDEVPVTVHAYDARFGPLAAADVRGLLTDPFGTTREVTFQEDLAQAGTYTALVVPQDEGLYQLDVSAATPEGEVGRHTQHFVVRPSRQEYYDATLKRAALEHLAGTSGGVYYEPSDAGEIPANLRGRRTSTSVYRAEYLWDMPLLFGLVLVLLSAEWIYRRRKGLP